MHASLQTARSSLLLGLEQLRIWFLTRFPLHDICHVGHTSGVVFAGFGASEHLPSVVEMHLDGVIDDRLRHLLGQHYSITTANPAAVLAFGQSDMVRTFMEGIDPLVTDNHTRELRIFWSGCIEILLAEIGTRRKDAAERIRGIAAGALEKQLAALTRWRHREQVKPSLYLIQSLPKDELATVAESLVSLTSLKRRVSMDYSVGGPIDVLVISKHDGCVWVKKKQYFSADLNPGFFTRKHIAWEELSNATKSKGIGREAEATAESVSLDGSDSRSLLSEADHGPGVAGSYSTTSHNHAGVGTPSLDDRGDPKDT